MISWWVIAREVSLKAVTLMHQRGASQLKLFRQTRQNSIVICCVSGFTGCNKR